MLLINFMNCTPHYSPLHIFKSKERLPAKNVTGNSYFHPYHFGGLSEAAVKSMISN
jgi:hypothetical protein